jgi:murein DD-endopeptidase MepM/ murein hydrolase activator NlpD
VKSTPGKKAGDYISIETPDGRTEMYMHCDPTKYNLQIGDEIKPGQSICLYNKSGNASRALLHFAVKDKEGNFEDPIEYLRRINKIKQ